MSFYGDKYHPTEENDIDEKKVLKELQQLDMGRNEYIYTVIDENNRKKKKKVVAYGSGDTESQIRDAVTGRYTQHLVGSADEDLYFTVIEAGGLSGKGRNHTFFYDSPEQYEREHNVVVNERIKEKWANKRSARLAKL
jgi:hypothetical protein